MKYLNKECRCIDGEFINEIGQCENVPIVEELNKSIDYVNFDYSVRALITENYLKLSNEPD